MTKKVKGILSNTVSEVMHEINITSKTDELSAILDELKEFDIKVTALEHYAKSKIELLK